VRQPSEHGAQAVEQHQQRQDVRLRRKVEDQDALQSGCGLARLAAGAPEAAQPVGPLTHARTQMLTIVLPDFSRRPKSRWASQPFHERASKFFEHPVDERGLHPASILHYKHHPTRFEAYL